MKCFFNSCFNIVFRQEITIGVNKHLTCLKNQLFYAPLENKKGSTFEPLIVSKYVARGGLEPPTSGL